MSRPAALLAMRVGPADVGRRVTIRHRTHTDPPLTDVVGVLLGWADGVLHLRRRDGSAAAVAEADVVAARVVDPEVSAWDALRAAQTAWPPATDESLGDWALRHDAGGTGRANSVLVLGEPGVRITDALDTVVQWYADRNQSALLQLPEPSTLDDVLEASGWVVVRRVRVLTVAVQALTERLGAPNAVVVTATADYDEWCSVQADLPARAADHRQLVTRGQDVDLFVARSGRTAIGSSRVVAATLPRRTQRWAFVTNLATAEPYRRAGTAHALVESATRWATDRSCERIVVQVLDTNDGALDMYERWGFTTHHTYVYRAPAADGDRDGDDVGTPGLGDTVPVEVGEGLGLLGSGPQMTSGDGE